MTKEEAILKSIEHWEAMRDWAKKQPPGLPLDICTMGEDIHQEPYADDCALCNEYFQTDSHSSESDSCGDCPLGEDGNGSCCKEYFRVIYSEYYWEFVANANEMIKKWL